VVEADRLLDAVLASGVDDVAADRGPVGDRLRVGPRPEGVAEGEHVGVRPDARVAEQVPGAADRVPRLEDGEALVGALLAQVAGGTDTGETGPHDEDVEVFGGVLGRHGPHS
jgi:hypothetical protein